MFIDVQKKKNKIKQASLPKLSVLVQIGGEILW